jgi:hypothetical protein
MLEYGDEFQAWKRHSLRMNQIKRGIQMIEDRHEKPPVSEFDDHALWLQELDDYRISDKFLKLEADQQQIVLELMNEHADLLKEMTAPAPDPDTDPELKPTDAAQQNEAQVQAEGPPPEVAAEATAAQAMGGAEQDQQLMGAQSAQMEQ